MLQSKGVQSDGGNMWERLRGPDAYFSGGPCPPFSTEHAQLLHFLLQIDGENRARLDTMPLPVELPGDSPCS